MPKQKVLSKVETNIEFVTRVMNFNPHGALMQAMVIEALSQYANKYSEKPIPENDMVDPQSWQACAKHLLKELSEKYGKK